MMKIFFFLKDGKPTIMSIYIYSIIFYIPWKENCLDEEGKKVCCPPFSSHSFHVLPWNIFYVLEKNARNGRKGGRKICINTFHHTFSFMLRGDHMISFCPPGNLITNREIFFSPFNRSSNKTWGKNEGFMMMGRVMKKMWQVCEH